MEISIFLCFFSSIIYSFALALSSPRKEGKKPSWKRKTSDAFFSCIQSLIHKKRREKEKGKSALEIIKSGIEKFGKNCHLPRLSIITTTNMCIWIFSYMLDDSPMLSTQTLVLLLGDGEKKASKRKRKKRKKWKFFYRNASFFWGDDGAGEFFTARLCAPPFISWGRFTFNIWITQRVVVERENEIKGDIFEIYIKRSFEFGAVLEEEKKKINWLWKLYRETVLMEMFKGASTRSVSHNIPIFKHSKMNSFF